MFEATIHGLWQGFKSWFKGKFCLSTIALCVCWLNFGTQFNLMVEKPPRGNFIVALLGVLGVYSYRSQKKRKLGLKPDTKLRKITEIVLLVLLMYVSFGNFERMIDDPVPYLIIPAWVIIAYIVVRIKKYSVIAGNTGKPQERNKGGVTENDETDTREVI